MIIIAGPSDLTIEQVTVTNDVVITARATSPMACCPCCGTASSRVHSHLQEALREMSLELGGEAGARLGKKLSDSGSPDTILRPVKGAELPTTSSPRIVGLDDWSWKRRLRYGTLICDLESHHPIDVLPDRSVETVSDKAMYRYLERLQTPQRPASGSLEGHVNRLKLLKRSMYGRARLPLLRARVLHVA